MAVNNQNNDPAAKPGSNTVAPEWAWSQYRPDDQRPWNVRWAAHLYRRAAFGGTWKELQQALSDGPSRTVDRLLHPASDVVAFNKSFDGYETGSDAAETLRAWWLRRIIETPHPLLERATLFWHSHFGISHARVARAPLIARHVQNLRGCALGSYSAMLATVVREPAAFVGLGADANRKARPNLNLARQLLGQYGPGAEGFDEHDVQETARAFTGWFVLRDELRHFDREHDEGHKKILGQQGNWAAADAVRIVLDQPATAQQVLRGLYHWLISETEEPSAELLTPLAAAFHKDYDIGRVVETILRSNLFFSPHAYRQRIKSPIEFAVGLIRPLEGSIPTLKLGDDLAGLGQNLYSPPTAKGWLGGRYWINAATVIGRSNLAASLLTPGGPYGDKLDPAAIAQRHGRAKPESAAAFFLDLFLGGDVPAKVREGLLKNSAGPDGNTASQFGELVQMVTSLPEFQLC